jgi:hypothetical protein
LVGNNLQLWHKDGSGGELISLSLSMVSYQFSLS